MKSLASLLLLFNLPSILAFVPQSIQIQTHQKQSPPSILVLEASASKHKKSTRTKWAASRNYATQSSNEVRKSPKLIIAGAPASGKGTQCELIKEKYGVVHLSTGDMLRAAVAAETEVGKMAKNFMDAGKLVPDDVIIGVVSLVVVT
jgi:adenylate kinase